MKDFGAVAVFEDTNAPGDTKDFENTEAFGDILHDVSALEELREKVVSMAISTKDFTENMCITFKDKVFTITECYHISPVKGPSMVRTKLRNIQTGEVIDNAFNAAADVNEVEVDKKPMKFEGEEADHLIFASLDGEEKLKLSEEFIRNATEWMKVGDEIALIYIDGKLEGIEPLLNG